MLRKIITVSSISISQNFKVFWFCAYLKTDQGKLGISLESAAQLWQCDPVNLRDQPKLCCVAKVVKILCYANANSDINNHNYITEKVIYHNHAMENVMVDKIAYIHTDTHTHRHTNACIHTHTHTNTYTHVHIFNTHLYTHINKHPPHPIHTHTE